MTNKKRQEIIYYLEKGDKFSNLLISELNRTDLATYEMRTYSSMLDAITGSTELYCAMTEWPDDVNFVMNDPKANDIKDEDAIVIEHGQGTLKVVKIISDYVRDLPLLTVQNDALIKFMTELLTVAEREAYEQGFSDCVKVIQKGGFKGLEHKIVKLAKLEF